MKFIDLDVFAPQIWKTFQWKGRMFPVMHPTTMPNRKFLELLSIERLLAEAETEEARLDLIRRQISHLVPTFDTADIAEMSPVQLMKLVELLSDEEGAARPPEGQTTESN